MSLLSRALHRVAYWVDADDTWTQPSRGHRPPRPLPPRPPSMADEYEELRREQEADLAAHDVRSALLANAEVPAGRKPMLCVKPGCNNLTSGYSNYCREHHWVEQDAAIDNAEPVVLRKRASVAPIKRKAALHEAAKPPKDAA